LEGLLVGLARRKEGGRLGGAALDDRVDPSLGADPRRRVQVDLELDGGAAEALDGAGDVERARRVVPDRGETDAGHDVPTVVGARAAADRGSGGGEGRG